MEAQLIDEAVRVPDNDPRLAGVPTGCTKLIDGVFYVRESDWLPFILLVAEQLGGKKLANEVSRKVSH